mgnify:FL=1
MKFINDVLFLGISDIKTPYDFYNFIGPYSNEISNLLTFTILRPMFKINFYDPHTHIITEELRRYFIDFVAVCAIVSNSIYYAEKYNDFETGYVKGILLVFFTFIVPTLFLHRFSYGLGGNNNIMRLLYGILFIYLLDFSVNLGMYLYFKYNENNENKNNKHENNKHEKNEL